MDNEEKKVKFENIVLVIIDQFRADYGVYMKKCSELLPYSTICDTMSFPASTETMHTNISTGVYPKDHEFVSKRTKDLKIKGLEELIEKFVFGELSSISSLGREYGFKVYSIGKKPEVVEVMGSKNECEIRVYQNIEESSKNDIKLQINGENESVIHFIEERLKHNNGDVKFGDENIDKKLLDIFGHIFSEKKEKNSFFILTLPSLDHIGHKYGPNSYEAINHIKKIDSKLHNFINCLSEKTAFIITGDHGCRFASAYLIESDNRDPRNLSVYLRDETFLRLENGYRIDKENKVHSIQYDGGILRVWFNDKNCKLSDEDYCFLSSYGNIIDNRDIVNISDKRLQQIYYNSINKNLGDVVVVANNGVSFCKNSWIERGIIKKISKKQVLDFNELPIGEHGSYHDEDRHVYLMSNYNFKRDKISNIQIRELIEEIMTSIHGNGKDQGSN